MTDKNSPESDEASKLWQTHTLKKERRSFVSPIILIIFGAIALTVLFVGLWIVAIE